MKQVTDILSLMKTVVGQDKWQAMNEVVEQTKCEAERSNHNHQETKRRLLHSIRAISGLRLWNLVIQHLQNINEGNSLYSDSKYREARQ